MLRGEAHPMHKLTEEQILQIRELYKIGHRNINVIARNYKVSPANIKKIVIEKVKVKILLPCIYNDFTACCKKQVVE